MGKRQLRLAVLGCGFWARYQIAAWRELEGVELVALYNRTRNKAETLARELGVTAVYDDAEKMFREVKPDFVDIITEAGSHAAFVRMAARFGVPVICQKPMAESYADAKGMVAACREADVPFFVHENFRWQAPMRALREKLQTGAIGKPFRARISFCCSFPVFDNQPFLAEAERFIIADVGSHVLDLARFFLGEARTLYCRTARVNPNIRGEDVATILLDMVGGAQCLVEMSYASRLEDERFPQTFVLIEGEKGSLALGPDFRLSLTDRDGAWSRTVAIPEHAWAHPKYAVVHSSGVPANRNFLEALRGGQPAETTGEDNLKTMELVFAAYESARTGAVVAMEGQGR